MDSSSIIQKESDNTNSLAPICSPRAPDEQISNISLSSSNNQILSNDECNCKYCSAIYIIQISQLIIDLQQRDLDDLYFNNSSNPSFQNKIRNKIRAINPSFVHKPTNRDLYFIG